MELQLGSTISWSVPISLKEERFELWQGYLADVELSTELADNHLHSAGRIAEWSRLSMRKAELNRRPRPLREDIRQAAWISEGGGMGALAQSIQTDVPDNALVLRPQTRQELLLLIQRCRGRETLGENLGITVKSSYQVGVRVLFTGPSGKGKTLASGWLATHLNLPLYRVDLASVTSKYIGETEKNLSKLLAKAEQDEVVLLFDEADALFGKRTEVKDANDRFANAQTNYLLQRIESYKGIVLLTSNSRARFDPAFTRRLDMIVDFPAPGPEERRTLWQVHLGGAHQLSARQLNQLAATCDLCGGHIRNASLTAALKAQVQSRPIRFADIIEGLTDEYKKLSRQMP
ncbi:MAG: ATP-binding protein, partial [bacterium]|nr:ATP-binding protein [bacterium]